MFSKTLVNTNANHFKFYTVILKHRTVKINFGRIGTKGQTKLFTLEDREEAEEFAMKRIDSKLNRRGYREVH